MSAIADLAAEFERETATTRKHLERLPSDQFDWRPHEKSFTAGALAAHIVDCIGLAERILVHDELDIDPATYQRVSAATSAALLAAFDEKVQAGSRAIAASTDSSIAGPWRFKVMGRQRFERPKAAVFRDFTLSHVIHHRGQFSVYLRLLNVPVPGSYGPTADERPGA
jgi:uncharacterized damage-inducible protein DinB